MVVTRHPGGMTAPPSNDGYILKWEIWIILSFEIYIYMCVCVCKMFK
jgi:hypothetical protein